MRSIRFAFTTRAAVAAAALMVAVPAAAFAQEGEQAKPAAHGAHGGMMHASGWQELDALHETIMKTWHPAKGDNDLKPIRAEAAELLRRADALAAATPPERCAGDETRAATKQIADDARMLTALVTENGSDREIMTALSALHDRFEEVMKRCGAGH